MLYYFKQIIITLDHIYMFCKCTIYNKFIKLFYATPKNWLAQFSLDLIFNVQQAKETWISYVHVILIPYFQCLAKHKSSIQYEAIKTFCPLGHILVWGYGNILLSEDIETFSINLVAICSYFGFYISVIMDW